MKLGDRAQDVVTGFQGIVTARTEYLHSTPRLLVEGHVTDPGKEAPQEWFEESRLIEVSK